jgi:hypothetical protein
MYFVHDSLVVWNLECNGSVIGNGAHQVQTAALNRLLKHSLQGQVETE